MTIGVQKRGRGGGMHKTPNISKMINLQQI